MVVDGPTSVGLGTASMLPWLSEWYAGPRRHIEARAVTLYEAGMSQTQVREAIGISASILRRVFTAKFDTGSGAESNSAMCVHTSLTFCFALQRHPAKESVLNACVYWTTQ